MTQIKQRVMLVIMDGVGLNPRKDGNAVELSNSPYLHQLWRDNPTVPIHTSGEEVGLPAGVMGNSEVGHLNMGAGRIVYQPLTLINKEIREGKFHKNQAILALLDQVGDHCLHLMGLLSTGGVHGDIKHVASILELCKKQGVRNVAIHCYMDGRDMPPDSGLGLIRELESEIQRIGVGRIATIGGRYWAMDRDKRWDRVKKGHDAVVAGKGPRARSAEQAMQESYAKKIMDEFIEPVIIGESAPMRDGDGVFFWNFRPDRAREITRAMMDPDFAEFERENAPKLHYLGMVIYDETFNLPVAYPPQNLEKILAQILAENGLKQYHTAETEKYAHVTFFFNGGVEKEYAGETRKLIASPKVATYDLQPEMSSIAVTASVKEALAGGLHEFIVVNYANGDMVGHTGFLEAAIKAVEAVNLGISEIIPDALARGYAVLVTADHGNCEQMVWYENGEPHTQHTTFDVNFTVAGVAGAKLRQGGRLADVAPTILRIMGLPQPAEMTGESLLA